MLGIGTDIIEIARVCKAVERQSFKQKVFTQAEQAYCSGRKQNAAASYAARFAAKEAFYKALGTGIFLPLTDVEVVNETGGKPVLKLHGAAEKIARERGVKNIFISLSHSKDFATAICVIE